MAEMLTTSLLGCKQVENICELSLTGWRLLVYDRFHSNASTVFYRREEMPTNPSALISELEAAVARHQALADAHHANALTIQRHVGSLAAPLPELGELYASGARMLATQAGQLVAKLHALAVLYRTTNVSATPPQQPQALDGAIWLPLHAADTEGGHAD